MHSSVEVRSADHYLQPFWMSRHLPNIYDLVSVNLSRNICNVLPNGLTKWFEEHVFWLIYEYYPKHVGSSLNKVLANK